MRSAASVEATLIFSYVSLAWVLPFSVISRNACGAPVFVPVVFVFISMRQFFLASLGSFQLWIRDALSADLDDLNGD
jgi:hypothetical protein